MFAPIAPWIVRCAYRVSVDALQRGLDLRLWVTGRGERRRQGRGSQVRWLPNGLQFHSGGRDARGSSRVPLGSGLAGAVNTS